MSSLAEAIGQVAPSFTGHLLRPADARYDECRRVHNGLINKHPAAIARCHGVAAVVDAVKLARTLDLDVAVRGGGHNVAGRATIDNGLLIDLSPSLGADWCVLRSDDPRCHELRERYVCTRGADAGAAGGLFTEGATDLVVAEFTFLVADRRRVGARGDRALGVAVEDQTVDARLGRVERPRCRQRRSETVNDGMTTTLDRSRDATRRPSGAFRARDAS